MHFQSCNIYIINNILHYPGDTNSSHPYSTVGEETPPDVFLIEKDPTGCITFVAMIDINSIELVNYDVTINSIPPPNAARPEFYCICCCGFCTSTSTTQLYPAPPWNDGPNVFLHLYQVLVECCNKWDYPAAVGELVRSQIAMIFCLDQKYSLHHTIQGKQFYHHPI